MKRFAPTLATLTVLMLAFGIEPGVAAAPQEPQQKNVSTTEKDIPATPPKEDAFSDSVANNVLNEIRDGLEGHSARLMLSAFDREKMAAYLSFEDQVQGYFQQYETFRVRFRLLQTSVEASRGVALAEFEIEGSPRGGGPIMRRTQQIRFELERGKKGWKIVEIRPRGFFA